MTLIGKYIKPTSCNDMQVHILDDLDAHLFKWGSWFYCAWPNKFQSAGYFSYCISCFTLKYVRYGSKIVCLKQLRTVDASSLYSVTLSLYDPLSLSGCCTSPLMETFSGFYRHGLFSCLGFGFARRCLSDVPRGPWDSDQWFCQR